MRLIDDALEGGQNGATRSQYTHGHLAHSMSHRARTLSNVSVVAVSNRFQESVQAGTRRTKLGRLGCDGTVESTRGSSCVHDNTGQSCTIITHAAIHLGNLVACTPVWQASCGDAEDTTALKCLDGSTEQHFVVFPVAHMSPLI